MESAPIKRRYSSFDGSLEGHCEIDNSNVGVDFDLREQVVIIYLLVGQDDRQSASIASEGSTFVCFFMLPSFIYRSLLRSAQQ